MPRRSPACTWRCFSCWFALFFRPVGFKYRNKVADRRWRTAWDWGLFIGGFVPALVFGIIVFASLRRSSLALLASAVAVVGVILTVGFSMFPFVMPSSSVPNSSLTAWDSVSSWRTLQIMFWVTVFFVPLIALYTGWVY